MNDIAYRLPNGCDLYPGGRIRVPAEHIWLIPEADIEQYGLTLGDDYSSGSEVVERKGQDDE